MSEVLLATSAALDDAQAVVDSGIARLASGGIDENQVDTRMHRFGSLEIGDETMRNFPFAVGDVDATLLGDDFLRLNEVWLSYPLQRLFIHPVLKK